MIRPVYIFAAAAVILFVAFLFADPVCLSYVEGASDWWRESYERSKGLEWLRGATMDEEPDSWTWHGAVHAR